MWDAKSVHSASPVGNLYPNSGNRSKRVEIPVAAVWKSLPKRRKAEQEAAEKAKRKKNRQRESNVAHQAKAKAERWAANDGHKYPKRICEQCGKEFYPNSTRQRFCNTDCTKAHQQAEKEKKRFAEKGEHIFRQKVCKICGKPFWPSNGQEALCSEECKTINRNQRQLAYYHRKQSGQKAGEAI